MKITGRDIYHAYLNAYGTSKGVTKGNLKRGKNKFGPEEKIKMYKRELESLNKQYDNSNSFRLPSIMRRMKKVQKELDKLQPRSPDIIRKNNISQAERLGVRRDKDGFYRLPKKLENKVGDMWMAHLNDRAQTARKFVRQVAIEYYGNKADADAALALAHPYEFGHMVGYSIYRRG
jgi:hypothetical protein